MKCIVCDSGAQAFSALHKIKIRDNVVLVCEECLPSLFAGCSKLVMEKSISGAYAADSVLGVEKRLEHITKNHDRLEEEVEATKEEVKTVAKPVVAVATKAAKKPKQKYAKAKAKKKRR